MTEPYTDPLPNQFLQRILPGLPVRVRQVNGRGLQVLHLEKDQPILILPLLNEGAEACEEAFDGTLEVFERGCRLSREQIERLVGHPEDLREHRQKRLILNHTEAGDPFCDVNWRSAELEIVKRPTLSRNLGERDWSLAKSIECQELRVFRPNSNQGWEIESNQIEHKESDGEAPLQNDRFQSLCRSIPTIRQSFGSFSSDRKRCDYGKGLEEFSLAGSVAPTQSSPLIPR